MKRGPLATTCVLIATLLYGTGLLLTPLEPSVLSTFSDVGMLVASGYATFCAFLAVRRQPRGRARQSWMLMALGLFCWFVGDLVWASYPPLTGEQAPTLSLADPWYLAFPVLSFAGLLLRPVPASNRLNRWLLALDVFVVTGSVSTVTWALVLSPLFSTAGTSPFEQAVMAAYPIGDAVVLCCLALLVFRQRVLTRPTMLLTAGWAAVAIADWIGYIPMTPFIGVRISWLIVARNSLLARSAAWAATASSFARRASSSYSCARRCSAAYANAVSRFPRMYRMSSARNVTPSPTLAKSTEPLSAADGPSQSNAPATPARPPGRASRHGCPTSGGPRSSADAPARSASAASAITPRLANQSTSTGSPDWYPVSPIGI